MKSNEIRKELGRQANVSNGGCGSTFLYAASVLLLLILTGCKTTQQIVETDTTRDSTATEIKIIKEIVRDTAYIEIPAQTAERTTADSVSHLENDYATSEARINPDGTLYHDLKTKPQKKPVPVDKVIEKEEKTTYQSHDHDHDKKDIQYVEVNKLTWWQKAQIYGLWALIALYVITHPKKIFSMIMRLFRIK